MSPSPERWDVFCRVVDHFGDAGIAWRLARQLARQATRQATPPGPPARRSVRLFVDGIDVLATIEPRIDPRMPSQTVDGVDVAPWPGANASLTPAAVVIELLGCGLPESYVESMAGAARGPVAPVWIDYEHLTAERWVDGFHGLPSPHPTRPLVKHFFYPGYGPRTGGLPIEPELACAVARGTSIPDDAVWRVLGIAPPDRDGALPERRVSLFAYPNAPVDALATALAADVRHRWTVVVPGGTARSSTGAARIVPVPLTDQPTYDRLLRACDVNFVRGEDSFVRAQVAGRPIVWQAYVQPDDAHRTKLAAFEARYAVGIPPAAGAAQRAFWNAWNGAEDKAFAATAPAWLDALPTLAAAARAWQGQLVDAEPLVVRLVAFVDDVRRRPLGASVPASSR